MAANARPTRVSIRASPRNRLNGGQAAESVNAPAKQPVLFIVKLTTCCFSASELVKKYQNGVIPAKAGIQNTHAAPQPPHWIPAFAGMT